MAAGVHTEEIFFTLGLVYCLPLYDQISLFSLFFHFQRWPTKIRHAPRFNQFPSSATEVANYWYQ